MYESLAQGHRHERFTSENRGKKMLLLEKHMTFDALEYFSMRHAHEAKGAAKASRFSHNLVLVFFAWYYVNQWILW